MRDTSPNIQSTKGIDLPGGNVGPTVTTGGFIVIPESEIEKISKRYPAGIVSRETEKNQGTVGLLEKVVFKPM